MKLLMISMNSEHPNDMHINYKMAFQEVCDIEYYGPGYTPNNILEYGIEKYIVEGRFDAVIIDFAFVMLKTDILDIREAYYWHRYTISNYRISEAIRLADKIISDLEKIDIIKIIYYWFDTYTFKERWQNGIDFLIKKGFYFLGPGIEFFPEVSDEEYLRKTGASNRYRYFCEKNFRSIISMCYATVNYIDMYHNPLKCRKYDITIPGNLDRFHYPERARIEDVVKMSELSLYEDYQNRTMAYLNGENIKANIYESKIDESIDEKLKFSNMYIRFKRSRQSILIWRENYKIGLNNSKIGYSCGAVSKQMLRKFVEIPCSGALLICENISSLGNYGFIDGKNVVTVDSNSVLEVCDYYLSHIDEMQRIADRGRELVIKKHTAIAHCNMTIDAIKHIIENKYYGSCWENGTLTFV